MNLRYIFASFSLVIGILFLLFHLNDRLDKNHSDANLNKKINLALRQTAHRLYLVENDSSSQIPPVVEQSENIFTLKLNRKFDYDTLPYILKQSLVDFEITNEYLTTIRSCQSDHIFLGYNSEALRQGKVMCAGRDQKSTCGIIEFTLLKKELASSKYLLYSILLLILGFLTLILSKRKPKISPIPKDDSDEVIRFTHSYFDSKSHLLTMNNQEAKLTFREAKLLEYFFRRPNQILKREDIQKCVWEDEGIIVGRSLDVFISRLRKILLKDDTIKIKSIHGIGYRLEITE